MTVACPLQYGFTAACKRVKVASSNAPTSHGARVSGSCAASRSSKSAGKPTTSCTMLSMLSESEAIALRSLASGSWRSARTSSLIVYGMLERPGAVKAAP